LSRKITLQRSLASASVLLVVALIAGVRPTASAGATPSGPGYWTAAADGGVFSYNVPFLGSAANEAPTAPIVGIAFDRATATGSSAYYLVTTDGEAFACSSTCAYYAGGSLPRGTDARIVGIATVAHGYWLVDSSGVVFPFGDASPHGSLQGDRLNAPVVGIASTRDGGGYWLVASDGGVFSFGDARFAGSLGGDHLDSPIVGIASDPAGSGYWLVGGDGGVFTFGGARFYGSTGSIHLNAPVVGIAPTTSGSGYWLAASDGGIFSFGDAPFEGSAGGTHLDQPMVGVTSPPPA